MNVTRIHSPNYRYIHETHSIESQKSKLHCWFSLQMARMIGVYTATLYLVGAVGVDKHVHVINVFCVYILAFDFCRFCVVIRFFHPRHNGHPRFYPLHLFSSLNS